MPRKIVGENIVTVGASSTGRSALSKVTVESGVVLVLPNTNLSSGIGVYRAANNVSAQSGFVIGGAANVTFSAGR